MAHRVMRLPLLAPLAVCALAHAQASDPMRPPGGGGQAEGGLAPAPGGGVQAVIVRPKGKSVAVINGRQVAVGDRLGDKQVVKIAEREVVLKGAGGREVIKVIPAIEKTPVKQGTRVAAGDGTTKREPGAK